VPPDRGVRAAQRPCRPAPGVGGRAHRGVTAGNRQGRIMVQGPGPSDLITDR
jgi:hypothetical protein